MTRFQRYMVVSGAALQIFLIGSTALLRYSPFDTGLREGARGSVAASGVLELLWVVTALSVAIARWRSTTADFRLILLLNSFIAVTLILELMH
jgi:hypothetical protein